MKAYEVLNFKKNPNPKRNVRGKHQGIKRQQIKTDKCHDS